MKIDHLTVAYGEKNILNRVSLEAEEGITCLMGESGSGKTTLLKVAAGLIEPKSGTVTDRPSKVSVMFQENRLFPWLTVLQNITVVNPDLNAARQLLQKVELTEYEDKLPSELSGGQCRRVALARALAYEAPLLVLDEPFNGMDAELTKRMAKLLKECGRTVLMTSHSEWEAQILGARILHLNDLKEID